MQPLLNQQRAFCLVGDDYVHLRDVPPQAVPLALDQHGMQTTKNVCGVWQCTELSRQTLGFSRTGLAPARSVVLCLLCCPLPSFPSSGFLWAWKSSHCSLGLIISPSPASSISDAHRFKCCCFLLLFLLFSPPIPPIFMTHKVRVVIILYLHGLSCLHHLLASK